MFYFGDKKAVKKGVKKKRMQARCQRNFAAFQSQFPGAQEVILNQDKYDMQRLMGELNRLGLSGIMYNTRYQTIPIKWSFFVSPQQQSRFNEVAATYRC